MKATLNIATAILPNIEAIELNKPVTEEILINEIISAAILSIENCPSGDILKRLKKVSSFIKGSLNPSASFTGSIADNSYALLMISGIKILKNKNINPNNIKRVINERKAAGRIIFFILTIPSKSKTGRPINDKTRESII